MLLKNESLGHIFILYRITNSASAESKCNSTIRNTLGYYWTGLSNLILINKSTIVSIMYWAGTGNVIEVKNTYMIIIPYQYVHIILLFNCTYGWYQKRVVGEINNFFEIDHVLFLGVPEVNSNIFTYMCALSCYRMMYLNMVIFHILIASLFYVICVFVCVCVYVWIGAYSIWVDEF